MMEADCQHLAKTLADYLTLFSEGLTNLPAVVAKREFAYVLMGRLLLIYDLQAGGFLNEGDRWYLHTRLSQHFPPTSGSFFKTFLQPLCFQGFALPLAERSRSLRQMMGDVPYLGGQLFLPHPLEQTYPDLDLADEVIEQFLGWLAEQPWQRQVTPEPAAEDSLNRTVLAGAWAGLLSQQTGKAALSEPKVLAAIAHETIDAHVLRAIAPKQPARSLLALLSELNDALCSELVTTVLPQLTILDPACGSGRLLLLALERLQMVYQACWEQAQQSPDQGLQGWVRSLQNAAMPPQWTLTRQLLTQNLYGVDRLPEAVTITQVQLWLRLLSTVEAPADLPLLPDLGFNITRGNALLGFIRVDAESFDQIAPKRLPKQAPRSPATETVLQGNLLQPLAAASYRDTLTEKKIRVEHYQAQIKAMGSEGGVPEYAQTEFLRDRIETVNQSVQQKLDTLLFETFSRKLGIQVKEPQVSGRTRKRLLTPKDIAALQPFHWGFFFNTQVEQQGGFDVILTQVPDDNLSPKADEFYGQHQALFQTLGIELTRFRRSRRQILQQFPEVARLWSLYVGQINAMKDYVRRGDDYHLPVTLTARSSISLKSLFAQRCTALAKADSIPPYIL